ncbi:MAG: ABC transporter ATP-binding protein [Smithellaceae bacterium]|nr:ABC transporter ATP-binding protein [Syntrophaceae bacterium]MDD4242303.1 ABC transporter ATP-binding protein [Smithellaceae bacterium]NLX51920.1 ABC transporter ATP-binding protein [Deltaproteobacteria bacterium]
MTPLLEVKNLTMAFGGIKALDSVDLHIEPGQIAALIGPNGAGKTTLFNCLTGIYTPTSGDIFLNAPGGKARRLNGLKINAITALGVARTFQNIRLFGGMTVLENVMIGRHPRSSAGILGAIFRPPATRREEQDIVDKSYALLESMGLSESANELASNLPYGAQRRLEIARALATEPRVLLLDEPAAGMNPQETNELEGLLTRLQAAHELSILLIEHDMKLVMNLAENIFVLDYGEEIARGAPQEIRNNPAVIKAYLGEEDDAEAQ